MKTLFAVLALVASATVMAEDLPVLKWQKGGEFDTVQSDGTILEGFLSLNGQTFLMEVNCTTHQSQFSIPATGQKDVVRPIDMTKPNRGKDIVDQFCGRKIENQMPKYMANSFKLPEYHAPDVHGDILRQEIMTR